MNISEVINDIKLRNALEVIALPFNKPVENVILEVLQMSIRTFSRFKPLLKDTTIHYNQLKSPSEFDNLRNIFVLPPELTTTPVQDAYAEIIDFDTRYNNRGPSGIVLGSAFTGFGGFKPQDMMNITQVGAAVNKYAGVTSSVPTSKWLGSNKIQLFMFPENCNILVTAKCNHDMNGETIEESCVESFMRLANLDVQITLYNYLKQHNTIGGAFKEIQLQIDNWANAEQAREELIKSWTETFHYDDLDLIQFF